MEYISSDSQASSSSGLAIGQPQKGSSFFDLRPDWSTDGYGLRGPQEPRGTPSQLDPHPMNFGQDVGPRPGLSTPTTENCVPEDPDTSIVYVRTTHWDGSAWVCEWEQTCDAPCPTPP